MLIFFYILLSFLLFSQTPNFDQDIWQNYRIKIDKNETESTCKFLEKSSNKEVANFTFYNSVIYCKTEIINGKEVLLVADHSGGESGGFYNINLIYKKNKIEKVSINDLSGYLNFEIIDANDDGKKELIIDSNKCFGVKFKVKDLKDEVNLTPEIHLGIIGSYKEIYIFDDTKLKNVTFDKKYFSYLSKFTSDTEKKLKSLSNKIINIADFNDNSKDILEITQYLYYMTKIGKKNSAIKKIKDSNISIFFDVNGKGESFGLYEILEKNLDKLLTKNKS